MDPLSHLLDGPSARRAFSLRVVMNPPWSIDVQDQAPLTLLVVMTGRAWLVADDQRYRLEAGDVAIVRGPLPYRVADEPVRDVQVIIHPGQTCTSPSGEDVQLRMSRRVRTWGNTATGETTMLIGTYETQAEIGSAVGAVLLVHAIRAWVREQPDRASGWLAAEIDPLVADTLELFHDSPATPWTIESLGSTLNVSRATIASRFRAAVGEPPMSYLTKWRMLLASELLADPRVTIAQIARQVGYGSPFALSTAFARRFGASPTAYRREKYTTPTAAVPR